MLQNMKQNEEMSGGASQMGQAENFVHQVVRGLIQTPNVCVGGLLGVRHKGPGGLAAGS